MSLYDHFSQKEIAILEARAKRLAAVAKNNGHSHIASALSVIVGGEEYAVEIDALTAVYENVKVVPIPSVPAHVAGVASLRGRIVPVLDLAVVLHIPTSEEKSAAGLLVASVKGRMVALLVEEIGNVISYSDADVLAVPAAENSQQARYLDGILNNGLGLLNLQSILNDPSIVVKQNAV